MFLNYLFILFLIPSLAFGKLIDQIVVTVDDTIILKSDLKKYRNFLSSPLFHPNHLSKIYSKNSLQKNSKKLLNYLIDVAVLVQNAPELQPFSEGQLLKDVLAEKKMSRKQMKRYLNQIPMSVSEYKDILKNNYVIDQWIQLEILSKTQISDEALNDYHFRKTGKNFFNKDKFTFNRWMFENSSKGLDRALEFVRKKEKSSGQEIVLTADQMNRKLKREVLKLSVGQFSKPVCAGSSCFVFELLHKGFVSFRTKSSEKLREKIFDKTLAQKITQWMLQNRKSSIIKKY